MELMRMNAKNRVFLLVLILCCTSCSYLKNIALLTNGKVANEDYVQAVPFDYIKGLIVVKAHINADSTAREFIFDTGAFNSKIEKNLAQQLGLKSVTSKTNTDSNGNSKTIEVTRMDSFMLGETRFVNIGAGKVEYGQKSASPCIAPHGIIGANIIKLAHWKIDFEARMLYFSDTPFTPEDQAEQYHIPFSTPTLSGTPDISIELDGKRVEGLLFDLGYNGGLILPAGIAESFSDVPSDHYLDKSTTGIYGVKADTLSSKMLTLNMGGYEADIPVEFSGNGKALLGNEILEHFLVFIDYQKEEITLQAKSKVEVPAHLEFLPGMLNDSLWVADRVKAEMPVRLGDTLQSINGLKPGDLFSDYCEYVMDIRTFLDQDSLQIVMKNGNQLNLGRNGN